MTEGKRVQVVLSQGATPVHLEETGPRIDESIVSRFEKKLGRQLPAAYREFLLQYNGGDPVVGLVRGKEDEPDVPYRHGDSVRSFLSLPRSRFRAGVPDYSRLKVPADHPWGLADDVLQIGDDEGGNAFVLMLSEGAGAVRFLDHEDDSPPSEHRLLADDFFDFLLRFVTLEEHAEMQRAEAERERDAVLTGAFPPLLEERCASVEDNYPSVRAWIRKAASRIFEDKGYLAVHGDATSRELLDLVCWLEQQTIGGGVSSDSMGEALETTWSQVDPSGFGFTGYAPGFIDDWLEDRIAKGILHRDGDATRLSSSGDAEITGRWQSDE